MMVEYVHIKHASADRPIYHRHALRPDRSYWNEGEGISYREWVVDWYEKMPCGVKLPLTAVFIQRDRARRFAQPCRRCFPEAWA